MISPAALDDCSFTGELEVKILDCRPDHSAQPWTQVSCDNSVQFERDLDAIEGVKLRIISFHSLLTPLPLDASTRDFETLFRRYNIDPDFCDTIKALGRFPDPANGYTTVPVVSTKTDARSYEAWYRLQYVERHERDAALPWSIRHTGVYHQYDEAKDFNLVILLNPSDDALFDSLLFEDTSSRGMAVRHDLVLDPLSIHQSLCKAYLPNWSPCTQYWSQRQQKISENIQTAKLNVGNCASDIALAQELRLLKSISTTCCILCQDNISVLAELRKLFPGGNMTQRHWLGTEEMKATARRESFLLLQDRVQNDIELLEHLASQRSQDAAKRLNETILDLTYNTVDDSATIKIITVFSLIFLPGSFIASIFGMNFFDYEEKGQEIGPNTGDSSSAIVLPWHGLTMGQNFWIFDATWLPVTVLTLIIYLGAVWWKRRIPPSKSQEAPKMSV